MLRAEPQPYPRVSLALPSSVYSDGDQPPSIEPPWSKWVTSFDALRLVEEGGGAEFANAFPDHTLEITDQDQSDAAGRPIWNIACRSTDHVRSSALMRRKTDIDRISSGAPTPPHGRKSPGNGRPCC